MWLLVSCVVGQHIPSQYCRAQFAFQQQPDILSMYLFNGSDEATFRQQLEQRTQVRIARIAEVVELDDAQRAKLELAAHGDLSRFYRELDHVRQKTKGLNPQNNEDQQKAWEHIMPVQQKATQGIITDDSLSERILRSLLTDEQKAKYIEFVQERRAAQFRAILRITVADLEKSLPLTEKQRGDLIKLVEGRQLPDNQQFRQAGMQAYLGFVMLGRLNDDELKDILDAQQLETFRKLTAPYANMF